MDVVKFIASAEHDKSDKAIYASQILRKLTANCLILTFLVFSNFTCHFHFLCLYAQCLLTVWIVVKKQGIFE